MSDCTRLGVSSVVLLALLGISAAELSAQGPPSPSDFVGRLDTNGNGMLDPNELEGRFGYFIKRMAQNNPRLDLSRPIPINRVAEEFQRMREERMRGGGGPGGSPRGRGGPGVGPFGGGPGGGRQPGRRDRGRRDNRGGGPEQQSPHRSTVTEIEPLVPAFGEEDVLTPAPGFGAEAELFTAEVTDEDRRQAERAFGYYDRNRDRKIDSGEMKRSRYGADLPMYDKNRDGNITLNEMEYRYARRRVENTGGNQSGSSSRKKKKSDDDDDSDAWLWSERLGLEDRNSYRVRSPVEQSVDGLPDWFAQDDANGDGQIAMAEWATSWSESELARFNQFDLNQDGVITPRECVRAGQDGATRDGSISVASTADSSSSDSSTTSDSPASASDSSTSAPATRSAAPVRIDPRSLDYFKKLVGQYDKNGDMHLEQSEWASMSKNPEPADVDGNGRVSIEEYARWRLGQ